MNGGRGRLEIKLTSDSRNQTSRLLRRCATQIRRVGGGGSPRRQQCVERSEHERYHYMQIISERVGGEATHTHEQVTGSRHATTNCRTVSPFTGSWSVAASLWSEKPCKACCCSYVNWRARIQVVLSVWDPLRNRWTKSRIQSNLGIIIAPYDGRKKLGEFLLIQSPNLVDVSLLKSCVKGPKLLRQPEYALYNAFTCRLFCYQLSLSEDLDLTS